MRKKWDAVKAQKSAKYQCPKCEKTNVKRISFAIWLCSSCDSKFAGGAYMPATLVGKSARMVVSKAPSKAKQIEE